MELENIENDEKLLDLNYPNANPAFDPDEAEKYGAFNEKAVSLEDAIASAVDILDFEYSKE